MKHCAKLFRSHFFACVLETGIAAMLLISVLIHLSGPYFFLESAARYQILNVDYLVFVLPCLAALQFVLAICLLTRYESQITLFLVGALFLGFMVCQISVLIRGITTDCGCFGNASESIGVFTVTRLALFGLLCFAAATFRPTSDTDRVSKILD